MRDYRAFVMEPDGRIRDRFEFWAEDDEKEEHARQYVVDGHAVEVWHRAERIAELKNEK